MATGRGKQAYREWLTNINGHVRDLRQIFRDGEVWSTGELEIDLNMFLEDLYQTWLDEDLPNGSLWFGRADKHVNDLQSRLIASFPNAFYDDDTEDIDEDGEFGEIPLDSPSGTVFGKPIVTDMNIEAIKAQGATRRKQLFPTLNDLKEYITSIPYGIIAGIQESIRDGRVVGFYVWIGDS